MTLARWSLEVLADVVSRTLIDSVVLQLPDKDIHLISGPLQPHLAGGGAAYNVGAGLAASVTVIGESTFFLHQGIKNNY